MYKKNPQYDSNVLFTAIRALDSVSLSSTEALDVLFYAGGLKVRRRTYDFRITFPRYITFRNVRLRLKVRTPTYVCSSTLIFVDRELRLIFDLTLQSI